MSASPIKSCPVADDWEDHIAKANVAMEQIDSIHGAVVQVREYLSVLPKISLTLQEQHKDLVNAVVGKDQISAEYVLAMQKQSAKMYMIVIGSLLFILVFVLTGQSFGFLGKP